MASIGSAATMPRADLPSVASMARYPALRSATNIISRVTGLSSITSAVRGALTWRSSRLLARLACWGRDIRTANRLPSRCLLRALARSPLVRGRGISGKRICIRARSRPAPRPRSRRRRYCLSLSVSWRSVSRSTGWTGRSNPGNDRRRNAEERRAESRDESGWRSLTPLGAKPGWMKPGEEIESA
jgi:hypothetical protein